MTTAPHPVPRPDETTRATPGGLTLLHVGGPALLLRLGGLTIVSDPGFDAPRDYPRPGGGTSTRLHGPAAAPDALGPLDVALVSHDQHVDNLDLSGRALLPGVPHVLTTPAGAARLGPDVPGVVGLAPWEATVLPRPDGGALRVTGVPARHGPEGAERVLGDVTGFVLDGDGLPRVYLSGDNAAPGLVAEVPERVGPVDVAIVHAGAARVPAILDGAALTLDGAGVAEVARLLRARVVVPVHADGWAHFSESVADVERAFAAAGLTGVLRVPTPGVALLL
ncbi:L-ascorbate metabolism protein UlaG (beta-lactamase superfamily) [Cellulosimicrobium cellulans]|uniref:MBL fold metallo-hydrolase n=1 Tax=Cellulosimicrobium cellulans TaxID=1710 RepID=UPI001956C792|nr:MBL fold metallo-hydrolase [Cellulosimicrobium cellulans]MBM7818979.1 L-ascorbate metabolism protein UlaG (beta-lactamase superfamily) [Cellulosimicrobium cellulans]